MTTTNTTSKLTKRNKFEMLAKIAEVQANPILTEFIAHEIELLDKKNSSKKPTVQQTANSKFKELIAEIAQAEPDRLFTVTEFLKALDNADLTNQRVSAMVRQMYDTSGENPSGGEFALIRIEEKRKAYFKFNPYYEG